MSKSEIQSWISSSNSTLENGDTTDSEIYSWRRDRVLNDWPRTLEYVHGKLLACRTRARVQFLQDELLSLAKHGDMSLSQTLDIFKLLSETYPRYVDTASRNAAEAVGMELVKRDELRGDATETKLGVTEQILGWFSNEVLNVVKPQTCNSYSSADLFVLLSWSCGLYTVCLQSNPTFTSTPLWPGLLRMMALLLNFLLDKSTRIKPSLQKSALVRTRRALRSASGDLPALFSALLSQIKSSQTPLHLVPLLGVAVDVTIRLKNASDPPSKRLTVDVKNGILYLYTNSVLMSRGPVAAHVSIAFNDFITTYVTPGDLADVLFPSVEKALLRSPEYALSVAINFFQSYSHPLQQDDFRRVLSQALNHSKSSNPLVRRNSVDLFKTLVEKQSTDANLEFTVSDLLTLPKSGKTTGPDHRVALYSMLAFLKPSPAVSSVIVQTLPSLLSKESHDAAIMTLSSALPTHITFLLRSNTALPSDVVQLIAKEITSSKPVLRRAFCSIVGTALWHLDNLDSGASFSFSSAVLPSLEVNLKAIAGNPLNSNSRPLEGYVAVALLLGPASRSGKFDALISQNAAIQSISSTAIKPSFLLWDKVYQKLVDKEEETWLIRATEAALSYYHNALTKSEQLRTQMGQVFLHLAVDSSVPETRRAALVALENSASQHPQLVNDITKDALTAFLLRLEGSAVKTSAAGSDSVAEDSLKNKHSRFSAFLLSGASFADGVDSAVREAYAVETIILSHHPVICGSSRQLWIELCQRGGADPHDLVSRNVDKLFDIILNASRSLFARAGYQAVSTLAFVSPVEVLPRAVDQLNVDINPKIVNGLTRLDLDVWATPEGVAFVDVLSNKRAEMTPHKGKDADIAKWEAELRKSLANKKAASSATLSKQDQLLVRAQLEKESHIRQRVDEVKRNLERGLELIHSLVAARVEDFRVYISSVSSLLLEGALGQGFILVGEHAFDTYLELATCCSERLDTFRRWTGIATLRGLRPATVPQELQTEALNNLLIRVLYRLRTLSEQTPFDAATFSYAFPLLGQVLLEGGLSFEEEDEALEQLQLTLDIIKYHVGEFSDAAFPRLQTMEKLVHTIRHQPKLSKDASSAVIDLGEAIHSNATPEEINVLLRGTLLQEAYVRNSCLQALQPFDLTDLDWSPELWVACHDSDEQNARLARHVWEDNGLDVPEVFLQHLLQYLGHENTYVRTSTSSSIADAVEHWPQLLHQTVNALQDYYREKAKILAPEFDQYGMVIAQSLDRADPWPARLATARAFELLAPSFFDKEVESFFKFLIDDQALGDRTAEVRRGMLDAGTVIIDLHGAPCLAGLIAMFEGHLARTDRASESSDQIKEAVVILFGRVARHLDPSDTRIPTIVERLVEALKTPAEQVQIAVSDCLAPLVKLMSPRVSQLVDQLFDDLFKAPKYATRRGAAYGLAGVVKGTGIAGIKEFNIVDRLRTAAEDKKDAESRQGCMFAFETLSTTLGRLFEPYIIHILPLLLAAFGDAIPDVREAAQDAARVIMGNMSGYGVKFILPSLLSGLDEKQWRTKKGSIELLGMMAYCSPRQLSLSLPIVIPRLTDVLTDSHAQVRTASNKSLKQFGEVISNPEIQNLVPVLLKALVDPAKTPNALSSLLKTSFMHYIDHSSLALVIPILERGLRERGADTKKKAAQIVGNLASLTDAKDFVPYLSGLLPMVHVVLVDPVPEARATAAKALGTLVERLGEGYFPDLVPGLLRTLKTDTSGVDRQGAAQGLSEVLSGLGMERLEGLLPDIIANAQSPRSTVREGFMSLLVFLPATFGTRFQPHLPRIIAPILGGLADPEEYVRDAAMRAGRMIVTNYSTKAIDLLLPELENGMFDAGWRIRQSSITLVGELLFKVSGISGKAEIEEDEEVAEATTAESSRRALTEILGTERRDRILSALYLARQDAVSVVRQASIHIWKALVHNTPRTVREILPELIGQIVTLISGSGTEQQETAGRTMAELCRKFGERMLADIIPILRDKSTAPDPQIREGVCLALCEMMENASESHREDHEDDIITMVRLSLVDDEPNVRSAAAKAFDVLQDHLGARAIDQTIPTLLEALRQPGASSGTALQALREVMAVRATTVFPVLIPTLIASPMTVFNARALASLVTVADNALSKRLTVIVSALVKVVEEEQDEELRAAVDEALSALFASVNDAEGLNTLMMLLLGWAKNESPKRRVSACDFFAQFCEVSELDYSLYRVDWIRILVTLFEDPVVPVHTAAWRCLDTFVKSIPKDTLEPLVITLRRTIESTGGPGQHVPGFSLPKGVSPTVPIIIAGLTTGSNEQREQAAYAIGDLVERTEESAIKPYVVPFTGPLIRVATQATTYPPAVKTAILSALTTMLERIPTFVKPFFPQLQRTFVKSTSDPSSAVVRTKAAQALGVLMKNQPRVDPVITELIAGARSSEDGISASLILALGNIVSSAGSNVGEKAKEACVELVSDAFKESHDEHYLQSAAGLFASLSPYPELLKPIVNTYLVAGTPLSVLSSHAILAALSPSDDDDDGDDDGISPNLFQELGLLRSIAQKILESVASDKPSIARPARESRDILKSMTDDSLLGLF